MDPWQVALIVSGEVVERRALVRDVDRGLFTRVRRGVLVLTTDWVAATPEQRVVVRARALAAVTGRPPVFSHFTAAVLHGLPVLAPRLDRLHTTVEQPGDHGDHELAGHVFMITEEEVVDLHGLLVTGIGRTVVDVAGSGTTEEGIIVGDAALAVGLPRNLLIEAVDLAGPRKAARRIDTVVDFVDPGGRSPAESTSRWSMNRMGIERPVLQFRVFDAQGHVGDADFHFPEADALGEVDGLKKYLAPEFAPRGAAMKVYDEKRREDRMRACSPRLARWTYAEGRDPRRLAPILARVGIHPMRRRLIL